MTAPHYFDRAPASPSRPRTVQLALPDRTLVLQTDRGVFSGDRVDAATKFLLLEAPDPPQDGDLLDLGCGYGPIAVVLALRAPAATVWAVDVNERALRLTTANATANGAPNVVASAPDDVPATRHFAALYSNPPVRVGKEALHALLARWVPRAAVAYLVVGKHLGADSLARWMGGERGWQVERLASRASFRLLQVTP